jgi:Kef-type K+ transport system membrane component KefB
MEPTPKMGQTAIMDLTVLALSLGFAVAFAYWVSRRRRVPVPLTVLAGLSLGPSTAFVHMWAHLFAISIVNFLRFTRGEFEYNLRFYALMQLGVVLLLISGLSLHVIRRWAAGAPALERPLIALAGLQMLFSFPLYPFNPIGMLPGLAAVLLLLVLALTGAQRRAIRAAATEYALA